MPPLTLGVTDSSELKPGAAVTLGIRPEKLRLVAVDSNDATLLTAVSSGQVEIAATAPSLIKVIRDNAPQRDIEVKFVMKAFPLGIGMRKGEAKLQKWINDWIQANTANGQLTAIQKKYHG